MTSVYNKRKHKEVYENKFGYQMDGNFYQGDRLSLHRRPSNVQHDDYRVDYAIFFIYIEFSGIYKQA